MIWMCSSPWRLMNEAPRKYSAMSDLINIILTFALILTGAAFGTAIYAAWSIIRYLHHISQWQRARNEEVK